MKLQSDSNRLEMGGVTERSHVFTIQATAKAFKILSDGLYSDKVQAVIRELSCNAYDAHVAVGKSEIPFELHLPNSFEPWFRVTDFGPGLSEDQIYDLYTSYFSSSKTDSNEYIGALGLGSKSPFSYTDSFTVTSYHGDTKKIYSAYLTEEGMPTIVKLNEETTTDGRTGVEVQISVRSHDYYEFAGKCQTALRYFPVTPKITGNKVVISKPNYNLQGNGWAIRSENSGARAIQGVVAYTIPRTNTTLDSILELPIDITFEIGELEVAASRETISMNKTTTANIKAKLESIKNELLKEIKEKIETAPSYWEACKRYCEYQRSGIMRYVVSGTKFTNGSRPVSDSVGFVPGHSLTLTSFHVHGYRKTVSEDTNRAGASFYANPNHVNFFVKDVESRGAKSLSKAYLKSDTNSASCIVVIRKNNQKDEKGEAVYTDAVYETHYNAFIEAMGNPEVVLSTKLKESLPIKPKAPRGGVKREIFRTLKLSSRQWSDAWVTASDEDMDAVTKYYIPTINRAPEDDSRTAWNGEFLKVINALKELNVIDDDAPIFEGSTSLRKYIEKEVDGSYVNLLDAKADVIALLTPETINKLGLSQINLSNLSLPEVRGFSTLKGLDPYRTHPFVVKYAEVLEVIQNSKANASMFRNLSLVRNFFNIEVKFKNTISEDVSKILRTYPLLSMNTYTSDPTNFVNNVRYMVAMDLLREKESQIAVS